MTDILRRYYKKALLGILLLNILTHLPFIHLPPCSIHVWRQCNTLAVARNFFEESNNIFQPRVDRRYDTDGITGMQFPAYEWGLAQLYRITGEQYIVQRSYSLIISCITLVFVFLFFFRYRGDPLLGLSAAWFLCWSPEWFYQGFNALPDILAFCTGVAALAFYAGWAARKTTLQFAASVFMLTLAGLIKIQYGIFGILLFTLIGYQYHKKLMSRKHLFHWIISGVGSFLIVAGWYLYANHLIQSSGLYDYVLQLRPVSELQDAISIIKKNLISDFPELLFSFAGTILVVIGLFSYGRPDNRKKWIAIPAFLSFTVWYVLMLEQMKVHQYYLLPVLLLAIFPVLNGIRWIINSNRKTFLWIILAAMPIVAMVRILPARWMKDDLGIRKEFADPHQLNQLITAVPPHEKVITVPDESGCIWLYFLHKKGFSYQDQSLFTDKNENGETNFEEYVRRGAGWIYLPAGYWQEHQLTPPPRLHMTQQTGEISVYKIN